MEKTMKEFILNLSDRRLARLIESVAMYGIQFIDRNQFAEAMEKDWCWKEAQKSGVTPEQYYCNL